MGQYNVLSNSGTVSASDNAIEAQSRRADVLLRHCFSSSDVHQNLLGDLLKQIPDPTPRIPESGWYGAFAFLTNSQSMLLLLLLIHCLNLYPKATWQTVLLDERNLLLEKTAVVSLEPHMRCQDCTDMLQ